MIPDRNSPTPATWIAGASGSPGRTPARTNAAGFTMLEMVVVLLIMGIVAAAATPTFYRSLSHHRLESAARRVKQDLEYIRDAAKAKSATIECEFSNLGYSFSDESLVHLDHSEPYAVDLTDAPYELDTVLPDFEGETIVEFNGYGAASLNGVIVLGLGDETRTVTLESSTGQITITNP